ncbi:MAG: zinc-ribbon domain-containing protein [Pyrinomonadaceae bacterium]
MYCLECGSANQAEVKFCRGCGAGLTAVSVAMARYPEPA